MNLIIIVTIIIFLFFLREFSGSQPRVREDHRQADPVARVVGEHEQNEVDALGGEVVRECWRFLPLVQELLQRAFVAERQFGGDHGVEDDSQTPHVRQLAVVVVSADQLGRPVRVAPGDGMQLLADLSASAAEIRDFESQLVVQ